MTQEKIQRYHATMSNGEMSKHHRYRSWEHCYHYFHSHSLLEIGAAREQAAIQLAFYLASWGMYRGSTFLLQHAYTIHLGVIDQLVSARFSDLWNCDFGAESADITLAPLIVDAVSSIRAAYRPFVASDTLVTKIILGSLGC